MGHWSQSPALSGGARPHRDPQRRQRRHTPATPFGSRDFTRCRGWFRGGRKRPRCEFSRRSAQIFVRLRRSTPSRDADGSALNRPCLSWIRHHHRRLVHGNSRVEETSHPVNQERLGLKDHRVTPKSHRDPIGTLILGCAVSPMSPRQFKRRSADHDRPSTGSGGRKKETQAMQQPLLSASVLRDDSVRGTIVGSDTPVFPREV
jgi:hypothetical protein